MTNPVTHPFVERYMARFDNEAQIIPNSRRIVLRAEISAHLSELIPTDATAEAVLAALDDLGSPVEIVSQELETNPSPAPTRTMRTRRVSLIVLATLATIWLGVSSPPLILAMFTPMPGWLLVVCGVVATMSVVALIILIRLLRRRETLPSRE